MSQLQGAENRGRIFILGNSYGRKKDKAKSGGTETKARWDRTLGIRVTVTPVLGLTDSQDDLSLSPSSPNPLPLRAWEVTGP